MHRVLLTFEPPDGGVPEAVRQLSRGLPLRGWEVAVAAPATTQIDRELARMGVAVHRVPYTRDYRSPASDARVTKGLVRLLRGGRFDILHAHSSKAGALGRIAAALAGVPAVYSPHCFGFLGPVGAARSVVSAGVELGLSPLTAMTVCVCEYEREAAVRARIGRGGRLRTIRNGSDPGWPPGGPPDEALRALRGDGVLAVAIAALRAQKRLETLVDAAPAVLAALPRARVAIVGSGPDGLPLRNRAAAKGLLGHPRFAMLPFIASMGSYLRAADVFVLPSAWEAFPIAVLEAMACGVPQVCTDVGGVGEAVDDATGRLVAPGDPDALAGALIDVLSDDDLRSSMGGASLARHAERYTLDRVVRETADVYAQALRRAS